MFMERLPDLASHRVIRPPSVGSAARVCRSQLRSSDSERRGCLWNWGLAWVLSSLPPPNSPPLRPELSNLGPERGMWGLRGAGCHA